MVIQPQTTLIKIGRFSQICQLTIKALRLYEEKGLLAPSHIDDLSGYRFYSTSQIQKGLILKQLAWANFSLKEMKMYIRYLNSNQQEKADDLLERKMKQIEQQHEHLTKVKSFLSKVLDREKKDLHVIKPEVKKVPKLRVVSMREKGTYGETISKLIKELYVHINTHENNEQIRIAGPSIFICHDNEYMEFDADIEIALPITGPVKSKEDIQVKYLTKCIVASVIHKGPYNEVGFSYEILLNYIKERKLEPIGPSREVYLNNPGQVKSEDELLTEVQIPIRDENDE